MGFDLLYGMFPVLYGKQVVPYIEAFDLDASNYSLIGNPNSVVASIFKGKSEWSTKCDYVSRSKNLAQHRYPNGVNHLLGAYYHWKWLRQYRLDGQGHHKNTLYHQQRTRRWNLPRRWYGAYLVGSAADGKVFTHWTGDVQYPESAKEYHTRVVMPNRNVSVTA